MTWFPPILMFTLSVVFWVLAHRSDELLTAWVRLGFAIFLLVVGILFAALTGIGEAISWAATHFKYLWVGP